MDWWSSGVVFPLPSTTARVQISSGQSKPPKSYLTNFSILPCLLKRTSPHFSFAENRPSRSPLGLGPFELKRRLPGFLAGSLGPQQNTIFFAWRVENKGIPKKRRKRKKREEKNNKNNEKGELIHGEGFKMVATARTWPHVQKNWPASAQISFPLTGGFDGRLGGTLGPVSH